MPEYKIARPAVEWALIGAMFADFTDAQEIAGAVRPSDFEDDKARKYFAVLQAVTNAKHPLTDTRRVRGALMGQLGDDFDPQTFTLCQNSEPAYDVPDFIARLHAFSANDRLQAMGRRLANTKPDSDAARTLKRTSAELEAILGRIATDGIDHPIGPLAKKRLAELETAVSTGETRGMKTGIGVIDDTYGGVHTSKTYIVAARPGVGKSSLAQQIGEHIAHNDGGVFFISLEMTAGEMVDRAFARDAEINTKKFAANSMGHQTDLPKIRQSVEKFQDVPMIYHVPRTPDQRDPATLANACRLAHASNPLSLIVLDYLQIVGDDGSGDNANIRIGRAMRIFQQLAMELDVCVMVLSQLSRAATAAGEPPKLHHLRDSGTIEQDANAVFALHAWPQDEQGNELDDEGIIVGKPENGDRRIDLIVLKMRGGECPTETLVFNGPHCQFHAPLISEHPNYESAFDEYGGLV